MAKSIYAGLKVLVVEDDDNSFDGLRVTLKGITGVEPIRTRGIADTLAILDEFKAVARGPIPTPDLCLALAIIDQNLSLARAQNEPYYQDVPVGEEGVFLVPHVNARLPVTQVGILTAYYGSDNKGFETGRGGGHFYFDKNWSSPDLEKRIKEILDGFLDAFKDYNHTV
ncbi:MAG: hypothetical protein HQL57_03705 [Magnetococcales bacterium]|nr:hypothetical protein [Magnetococcales bacterium]MBF0156274.1 hypothetical protein [Magnetococcales bacterium]